MLIDWLTCHLSLDGLSQECREILSQFGDRVTRFCPKTGEIRWVSHAWDSIRSDSHQVMLKVGGSSLMVCGSPTRLIGDGDNVFSGGPASSLDIHGCIDLMAAFVSRKLGVILPSASAWSVIRVDVTGNLELDTLADVRQALAVLRNCEGGRYRVDQTAGDSVYWSKRSRLRSGKAYAKGPHLAYLMKQRRDGVTKLYSYGEIQQASRLLRLELKLGSQFWFRNDWRSFTADHLCQEWQDYFFRMIGGAEMTSDGDIEQRIQAAAPTKGQGKSAYHCWITIQRDGWERARNFYSKRTWYRNLKILRQSGLGDADISTGNIVALRRRVLEARLVTCWNQLKAA